MKKHILQENYERLFGKREFGDPLPTFEDVMEKHQVNKLKEDWWDDMDAASQAQYIKDHPGSKQAQQADAGEEPEDEDGTGPGQGIDWKHPDDEEEKPSGEPEKVQAATDTVADLKDRHKGSKYQLIDKLETMKKSEVDDIQGTLSAERDRLKEKSTGEEDGIPTFDNDEDAEAYWAAESAASDFYNMTHHYGDEVRYQPEDKEGGEQGRTGKELDQETLTIDGKQFRRISEGVEKQPKPKYEFSEFYQRFKRQE